MERNSSSIGLTRKKSAQAAVFRMMYIWMSLALALTGFTAMIVSDNGRIMHAMMSTPAIIWGVIIAEIVLVLILAAMLHRMSLGVATVMFIAYSILNGVSMSTLFLLYTEESIALTFFITSGTFGATSVYGFLTKKDLSSMGSIMLMAILGLIIASIVNIFMGSSMLYWIITYAGVLIFVGLTAYDTQKFKNAIYNGDTSESTYKLALMGALELYLDFINMFIHLLRILGDRR